MKKLIKSSLILAISIFAFNAAHAQSENEISVGVGLMYGSEIEKLGIRVDGVYPINEQFRAVADLGFFFPDKTDFGGGSSITVTWWELNANGNYLFYTDEESGLMAYGLAGLNFTTLKVKSEGPFGAGSNSNTELGLNIGAGGEYALDFANLFAELKFVIGDADQVNIGVGLRFKL